MTFKQGIWKVGQWFLGSLATLSIGLLLLVVTDVIATKKDKQTEMDSKATKIELTETKSDLSKKIEDGDNAVRAEHKTYTNEHSKTEDQQTKLLESMDRKIDILLTEK